MITMLVTSNAAWALEIKGLRIGHHSDKTRIVIDTDKAVTFKSFTLQSPNRLVLDLPPFAWNANGQIRQEKASLIAGLRHGQTSEQSARIVLDTKAPVQIIDSFDLPAKQGAGARIVIDIRESAAAKTAQKNTAKPAVPAAPAPKATTKPVALKHTKPAPRAKKIIVIDPGHGGKDPGAVSGKVYEKNIVLALSKELKKQLEATGLYKVHLTRSNDRFIKLYNRVKIARNHKADLFISVHADSLKRRNVRGASVYTLSEKASDAQTAKLAARENKADLIDGIDLTHEDKDVADILLDLVQRDTMNQSNFFAEKLVASWKNAGIRTLDNPHRSAGFAVLKAPDVPSILIEAGFISNRYDVKLLTQSQYRKKLAKTIAQGVNKYLKEAES